MEQPRNALPRQGGVKVTLRPKITEGLSGVSDYMKRYPYSCLEQKTSIAIALRDKNLWQDIISELPSHLDADGLAKYFPPSSSGDPILTSYPGIPVSRPRTSPSKKYPLWKPYPERGKRIPSFSAR
ncbi:MAG: hypothetical protein NTY64_12350 [Deltaproteobacteria bacterium]|nr:hypothetical protein [Deltaproteobacteria bacterium]